VKFFIFLTLAGTGASGGQSPPEVCGKTARRKNPSVVQTLSEEDDEENLFKICEVE